MKKQTDDFCTSLLTGKLFPILLLLVMVCAYATQIPQLGFYLDDWVSVASFDQGGEEGLLAFGINDSRPFAAWVTAQFFKVLGTSVIHWQLITLFWRFAAAFAGWRLLRNVWPEHQKAAGFISLLFGVFPFFRHQPMCIAYFMILMQYFTVILSFYFTVKALRSDDKKIKILFFVLSYLTSLFHLACLEYYLSLEGTRLFLIFFVIRKRDRLSFRETVKKTIPVYIPYALILVFILLYRFIYIPSLSEDVREISMFSEYKGINIILHLGSLFVQYLSESLMGIWYRSLDPQTLDLSMRHTQLGAALGLAAGILTLFVLRKNGEKADKGFRIQDSGFRKDGFHDESINQNSECKIETEKGGTLYEMLLFGFIAMVLGYLPGMMINASPSAASIYNDRYLIPSFWGIAIFTVSWISILFRSAAAADVLFSSMICLSVFFQVQNAYAYRYSWKYQQKFQWQMKWRIPDIVENTAVISDGVVSLFMGDWADSSMLFEMYGKKQGLMPTPYWYFNRGDDDYFAGLTTGESLYIKSKMYEFEAEPTDVIVITKPEYGKCAWLLGEEDRYNPYLEEGMHDFIRYQNRSRIRLESDRVLPAPVFGTDFDHDWCYYFEKADLALDKEDYAEALRLYDEASANGYHAGNALEMRPFIKAAAFSGDWEKALEWSENANSVRPDQTTAYFRNLWKILDRDVPDSDEKAAAVADAGALFAVD